MRIILEFVDRLLLIGGRLSLTKCRFFVTCLTWCGVEINLATNEWRADPARVSSLRELPIPKNVEALTHVLGILRYYYWTVIGERKQIEQRSHLAKLSELDQPRIVLAQAWADEHTAAMRAAIENICCGDWLLVYDPSQPVYVSTDASSHHGFGVAASQYDSRSGVMRPIACFSLGWLGTQLRGWTPQVKEAYAIRYAVTKIMPSAFPYAKVIALCDNRNLAGKSDSEDLRVARWQQEISDAGTILRQWIPGDF